MLAQWLERRVSCTEGHEFDSHTTSRVWCVQVYMQRVKKPIA